MTARVRFLALLCLALFGCVRFAWADTGPRRVALVIGNSAYSEVARLPNPVSDAAAMGQALRDVGFTKVTVATDLTHQGLYKALRDFSMDSSGADWSVIYYAGHGIEVEGKNYLVPVDAHLAFDRDVDFEGISMQTVFAAVGGARQLRLVIMDACRDDPFLAKMTRTNGTRAISRGLARVEPEGDLYVVYSASSGQVAQDGAGQRSPFVSALLKNIETPGLEVNLLFRRVRADVEHDTDGQQRPDFVGSLPSEELYFKPPETTALPARVATPTPTPSEPQTKRLLDVEEAPTTPATPAATPVTPSPPPAPPPSPPLVVAKLEPPVASTPAADPKATAFAVQTELKRVGCDPGPVNGDWTIQSRMALLNFSQHASVMLDVDKPDDATLKALQTQRGIICPVVETPKPPMPKNATLEPETPKSQPARPAPHPAPVQHRVVRPRIVVQDDPPPQRIERRAAPRPAAAPRPRASCFMFNGQQVCE